MPCAGRRTTATTPAPSANTPSVPARPASAVASARVVDARERVVGHGRALLHGREPAAVDEALLRSATFSSPSGELEANGESAVREDDRDGEREDA